MFRQYRKNKEYAEKIDRVAKQVRIVEKLEEQVSSLSHGERRQLEFGLAIIAEPKMLLFDEPAAGLSAEERQVMKELIQNLDRSVTVIMIEHDIELAFAVADYVVVMFDGEVVAEGKVEEIRNNEIVRQIYLGEVAHEDTILKVEGVHVYYGGSHILQGVSMALEKGSMTVIGRNGMGKTTFVKAVMDWFRSGKEKYFLKGKILQV